MTTAASRAAAAADRPDRRALLLTAGLALYDEVGFDDVTVDMVAERAGVARGLVAYYFGTKDGLYREVSEQFGRLMRSTLSENPATDPGAWLEADVHGFLDLVEKHPVAMRNTTGTPFSRRTKDTAMSTFTVSRVLHALGDHQDEPLLREVVASWGFHCLDLALRWLDHPEIARADIAAVVIADLRSALATVAAAHPEFGLPSHPFTRDTSLSGCEPPSPTLG